MPPDDRVWRHPSEVALHFRRDRRRRAQRALLIGAAGLSTAAALFWLATEPSADLTVEADLAVVLNDTSTTSLIVLPWADEVAALARPDTVTVRSLRGTETLARALALTTEGFVITSGRALAGQGEVLVFWADQVQPATVLGYDEATDISVLQVAGDLPAGGAPDSESIGSGEMLSLVNPEGASESRRVAHPVSTAQSADGQRLVGLVELEGELGELPPGTPAVNGDGAVVGIATATADDWPAAVVPIALARGVADDIINDGAASHPHIGITARDVIEEDPVTVEAGAYVADVADGGPAALGGVEPGDVIVAVAGAPVISMAEMIAELRAHEPGDVIEILVDRHDEQVGCRVELDSHPDVE